MQLRWNSRSRCDPRFTVMNFGQSKGLTFDHVLLYPTDQMKKWVRDHNSSLTSSTCAKFYVGLTRARHSVAIVIDYGECEPIVDALKFSKNVGREPSL
jgi:DNA helicase-2/ATP-dependent DNA helicase PcrA